MPHTVRQYWRNLHGRVPLNFNWHLINHNSVVLIAASEYSIDVNSPNTSPRFVGAANVTVSNISPHGPPYDGNRGVTFVVTVDWPQPLHIVTDITVVASILYPLRISRIAAIASAALLPAAARLSLVAPWAAAAAATACLTASMLCIHQSMRSSGCSQLGVQPKSAG